MTIDAVSLEMIRELICARLGVEPAKVTTQATLHDDLGADSLDVIEIGMALEERFSVSIAAGDYAKIKTVGDAVEYVRRAASSERAS